MEVLERKYSVHIWLVTGKYEERCSYVFYISYNSSSYTWKEWVKLPVLKDISRKTLTVATQVAAGIMQRHKHVQLRYVPFLFDTFLIRLWLACERIRIRE